MELSYVTLRPGKAKCCRAGPGPRDELVWQLALGSHVEAEVPKVPSAGTLAALRPSCESTHTTEDSALREVQWLTIISSKKHLPSSMQTGVEQRPGSWGPAKLGHETDHHDVVDPLSQEKKRAQRAKVACPQSLRC